jgi:hypothetical protein
VKKLTMAAGALAVLLVLGAPLGAAAQTAPPGEAEATAAEVEGVAAVGETSAAADESSGEATGNAVRLGDEPPSEEFGGTQSGEGRSEGAMFDTDEQEPGRAQLTPWSAEVSEGDDERTADSDAALARAHGLDGNVAVEVLGSRSSARHSGNASSGESESTGASVMLGGEDGLKLIVLHAFSRSEGEGEGGSYVASVNANEIVSSEQAEGGVVDGITEFSAGVIDLDALDENLSAGVVTTAARGSDDAAIQPAAAPQPPAEAAPAPAVSPAPTGQLARTGLESVHLLALGLLLLVGGGLATRYGSAAQAA